VSGAVGRGSFRPLVRDVGVVVLFGVGGDAALVAAVVALRTWVAELSIGIEGV
jgi:hypothetical protein